MENEENIFLKAGKANKAVAAWVKSNAYGLVIALASLLVLIFFPMIGSSAAIGSLIPTTLGAAILFWTMKGLTVALNLAIFSAFRKQAKKDVSDHPSYKLACEILSKNKPKDYKPLSPAQFAAKQWGTKGVFLALGTAITTIALTNIILFYDWVAAVSCMITIILAIIFGLLNMASEETYWTDDFLQYAKRVDRDRKEEEKANNTNQGQETSQIDCFQANKEN